MSRVGRRSSKECLDSGAGEEGEGGESGCLLVVVSRWETVSLIQLTATASEVTMPCSDLRGRHRGDGGRTRCRVLPSERTTS